MSRSVPNSIQEHVSLLGFSGILAIMISWIAWRYGFYKFPSPQNSPPSEKLHFWELISVFAVFLLMMAIVVPVLSLAWLSVKAGHVVNFAQLDIDASTQGQLNVFAIVLSFAAVVGFAWMLNPRVWRVIWGREAFRGLKRNLKDCSLGIVSWFICFPIVVAAGQLIALIVLVFDLPVEKFEQVAVRYLKMTAEHPYLLGIMAFLLIFVVPIVEEILFRGFLQTWLKQNFGRGRAIVIASSIFAFFHFSLSQGLYNVELLLSLFILSCFLGFLYERQQSLWASIGLHAIFNTVSVIAITSEVLIPASI